MTKHTTLFLTQRGLQHQQWAVEGAPPELALIMRRGASREELLALLADAEFLITERTGVIDAEMIAAAPKLRLIQRLGRQTWDIDLDAVVGGFGGDGHCLAHTLEQAEHLQQHMLSDHDAAIVWQIADRYTRLARRVQVDVPGLAAQPLDQA